ncbi:hypothetical protein QSZ54_005087 [Escherichia coli]|nr:hypothetical protein [Escherichia coli]ELH6623276.1 hypothetical protein [Escherichia coli]ELO4948874.1 hypothetical protein [Escherichia coli]ELO4958527.1 hypothetical protein [Escherichia coli]
MSDVTTVGKDDASRTSALARAEDATPALTGFYSVEDFPRLAVMAEREDILHTAGDKEWS